jgi:predicted acylesterase/phospholipase RssA
MINSVNSRILLASLMRILRISLIVTLGVGCGTLRKDSLDKNAAGDAHFELPDQGLEVDEIPDSAIKTIYRPPKMAFIFGPGGLLTHAHAGFISKVARAGLKPHALFGIEMGALPAALWAQNAKPFEAQWQMSKLQENDFFRKRIISGAGRQAIQDFRPRLISFFGKQNLLQFQIPFSCPAYSSRQNRPLLLTRGSAVDALTYCMPYEPIWEPTPDARAFPISLRLLAERARSKGSELVIFVDLLNSPSTIEQAGASWSLIRQGLIDQFREVDLVIPVSVSASMTQFSPRSELFEAGEQAGQQFLNWLGERGL